MELKVQWINATRLGEERAKVERIYEERLLDLFETPEKAYAAKESWHRSYEPPIHHWTTYNRICQIEATTPLTPCERHLAHFVVRFENNEAPAP